MTTPFRRSAEVVAEVNGLPGYPFAVIEHPIANDDDAALRVKAGIYCQPSGCHISARS